MTDLDRFFLNIVAGAIVGVITALVSVRLALSRFRAERTWDRKASAYTEIFDALYHVQRSITVDLRRVEEGAEYGDEFLKSLGQHAADGYDTIRRAAVKGSFVVGAEAAAELDALVKAFDDPHYNRDWHEELSKDLGVVDAAIKELRRLAVVDLHR